MASLIQLYLHRHSYFCTPFFCSLLLIFAQVTAICTPSQENITTLEPGQSIERQLKGGETHAFQVSLQTGQFLSISVEQRGIDIELKFYNPNRQLVTETDALNGTQGPEVASIIAAQPGIHRIDIVSPGNASPTGSYEVKILAIRPATEQDHRWILAQQFYTDGRKLSDQSTAETQEQATRKFTEALRIWEVLADRLMVVHTLYYLVAAYRDVGQTQHALVYSGYALEILRSIAQKREEAPALTTLAIILNELGELPKALEYYEQALIQWRLFHDVYGEARTLINLGLVNTQLGEIPVALKNYNQALAVWQKLGNRFQAAETLTRIGIAYDRLGEWQKSLEYAKQAQVLYRAIDNQRGEAAIFNNIGLIYENLGEVGKALDYYNQSLAIWHTLGNHREEAEILSNIGLAESKLNNQPKALTSYQLALKLWRESGDRRGEAQVLQRLGDLQGSSKDVKSAFEFYNQALPLLRTAGDTPRESSVLISIADLHLLQGKPEKAKEFLNQALTIMPLVGNRANEAQVQYGLARAELDLGNLNKAHQHIKATIAKTETLRTNVETHQLRASYLASVHKYYELNLDILMSLHQAHPTEGYDARAMQANEHARARSLLELLTDARSNIREGVDPSLLEREDKLKQQLNSKAKHQLLLSSQHVGEMQLNELKREISALEDEYNQLQADIRKSSPHYAALTQPEPLNLQEIQQQLDDDSILLEYSLGEDRSWLWAVTKNSIASFQLPNRAEIEQAALQVRDLLIVRSQNLPGETARQREARLRQADTEFPSTASALSQMILSPIAPLLENRRLVIVADGALQYVPFGALPEPSRGKGSEIREQKEKTIASRVQNANPLSLLPAPLILNHEIIMLPSASTIAVMRKEIADRNPAPKALAVFADPVFTHNEARQRSRSITSAVAARELAKSRDIIHDSEKVATVGSLNIQRLPYTRQEAEQILAFVPQADSFKAIDFAANRTAAMNPTLSQYRYLHFATHGLIDSERPGLSALVLSLVDEQGNPQDGFLRVNEIYNLKLPAELVVLSACQTGLGKEIRGEGLVGLTRGFMYAGAARVVVSLWSVNDKATSELMTIFYRQMLKENQRPAAALRAAQIEMWKQKQWQAPYYWAAFVLQGEWR